MGRVRTCLGTFLVISFITELSWKKVVTDGVQSKRCSCVFFHDFLSLSWKVASGMALSVTLSYANVFNSFSLWKLLAGLGVDAGPHTRMLSVANVFVAIFGQDLYVRLVIIILTQAN